MVQLEILNGKSAGARHEARRFPFRIGRASTAHLRLADDGVWDNHLALAFDPAEGFVLRVDSDALVAVNGKPCREIVLHNGDEISLGALRLRFWLAAARQKSLGPREWLTWIAFILITAAELALVYNLAP